MKTKEQKKEERQEKRRAKRIIKTEFGEANQDPNLGAFLSYFCFWFPKFISNIKHCPKMVDHDFWPWYRATKMFASHILATSITWTQQRSVVGRLTDDDVAKIWGRNLRPLLILAGYEEKTFGRIHLPIQRGYLLDTETLLAVIGYTYVQTTEWEQNNHAKWKKDTFKIFDNWGAQMGEFTTMHAIRVWLMDRGIISSAAQRAFAKEKEAPPASITIS